MNYQPGSEICRVLNVSPVVLVGYTISALIRSSWSAASLSGEVKLVVGGMCDN